MATKLIPFARCTELLGRRNLRPSFQLPYGHKKASLWKNQNTDWLNPNPNNET